VTDGAAPIVGVVGTGRMGSAMARALARAGLPLVLHNRSLDRAEALAAELGARVAATPAEAAAAADVTITMLADDDAVAQVYGADDGLLAGARRGSVLVDLSTVTPEALGSVIRPGSRASRADGCVSGWPSSPSRCAGTTTICDAVSRPDRARPALEALAKTIFHLDFGTGPMKLATNAVIRLNEALSKGRSQAWPASTARRPTTCWRRACRAPYVGTTARPSRPKPSRSTSPRRTCG
jgi:3-hydroxyisobutyrate dehydrogenase-like beta-hydroxyacid dehydrogenase